MGLNSKALISALASHGKKLGVFAQVIEHDPKKAPSMKGITASITFDQMVMAPAQSGLNTSGCVVVFTFRLWKNMLTEPQDEIDSDMLNALDKFMNSLHGDFDLGQTGTVESIDFFGKHGVPVSAKAGYIDADQKKFRSIDIDLPLVINDAWTQSA